MTEKIELIVQGAHCNNLQSVDISFPHGELIVFTGISGSGKSSLLFDTIVSEAQRRFVSGLTRTLRKNVGGTYTSKVDHISGLLPALAIRNRYQTSNRSSEDALADIELTLSVLFSRFAVVQCHHCSSEIKRAGLLEAGELFFSQEGGRILIAAPLSSSITGLDSHLKELQTIGYQRFQLNGEEYTFDDGKPEVDSIESFHVVVDRLKSRKEQEKRFEESFKLARELGNGVVELQILQGNARESARFTDGRRCAQCLSDAGILSPAVMLGRNPGTLCQECYGKGGSECLKTGLAEWVRTASLHRLSYQEALQLSLNELDVWLTSLSTVSEPRFSVLIKDLRAMIAPLLRLGAGYLSILDRRHPLSDGEKQKLEFSRALSLEMGELLLAFDEPLSGLHPAEREPVREMLVELRDRGNTVCVVEHDVSLIRSADRIIELGDGAGREGGRIVFHGDPDSLSTVETHTARAVRREMAAKVVGREPRFDCVASIQCSSLFCGDKREIEIPLSSLVGICGVSGSGKSRFINEIIEPAAQGEGGIHTSSGERPFELVKSFNQAPIGKNIRSCPATYTGAFDEIRELFAALPSARVAGFDAATFSFNTEQGRCGECAGAGVVQAASILLEDETFDCPICNGMRFEADVLRVLYKGVSIAEVLAMTASEANDLFANLPGVATRLRALERVGLGYIPLGQPTYTLSGGEAQRLKLAHALYSGVQGQRALFLLDQPTRGLHQSDILRLTDVLAELCEQGHSLLVVESEPTFLRRCDWIIEVERSVEGQRSVLYSGRVGSIEEVEGSLIRNYLS